MSIGERLREARIAQKMTQRGLAAAAGLNGSHVGLIETGRVKGTPETETVRKLAEALEVSFVWLATGVGSMRPDAESGSRRYPNREEAIAEMKWSDSTVAELRTWGLHSATDFSVETWIAMGRQIERAQRTGTKIGRPLDDEEDAPPAGG